MYTYTVHVMHVWLKDDEYNQGMYFGWISWFNPVDFLGDPVEICSLSLGGVYA